MYSKILIPLDGSTIAETVLPYARILAGALKIPLEFLSVVDISDATAQIVADKARYLDALLAAGERSNEKYLREVAARMANFNSRCLVERGKPAEVIVEEAATDKGTLIAMASHGRSGLNRWLLGSVAEKVLHSTSNPLLLVRANDAATPDRQVALKSIIVPLDGSNLAESILPAAVRFAECFNLEVILYRAYELPASAYYGSEDHLPDYDKMKQEFKAAAQQYLDAKVHALKAQGLTKVGAVLSEGSGAEEIIRYAREHADAMVAMCSRGRSGVKRWLLGSVTEKVVRHSQNPVLVIRAG